MPRTLAQNAQYIAETIKPAIKSAIEAQGVTVPSTDSFLDYADRIGEIEGGGSGYQLKDLPTGSISTVNDAAPLPLNALKVSVEAVQSGSGTPSPSNIRPIIGWDSGEISNISNYYVGSPSFDGYSNLSLWTKLDETYRGHEVYKRTSAWNGIYKAITLPVGVYTFSASVKTSDGANVNVYFVRNDSTATTNIDEAEVTTTINWTRISATFEVLQEGTVAVRIERATAGDIYISEYQIERGNTAHDYCSYQLNTTTLNFPTTIYGAEWDVINGELGLKITDGFYESYNGETLPGVWMSDRDIYQPGTTPTIGAQVKYKLATPTYVTLTGLSIRMLQGTNNIYADCGEVIEGEYFVGETKAYDLVEYIESDGTQIIDLGRQVVQGQTVKTVFHPMSNQVAYAWLFGTGDTSHYYGFQLPQQTTLLEYNGSTSSSGQMSVNTADENVYNLAFTASSSLSLNYYVFGFHYSETPGGNNMGKFRLYSLSINGDDYLPCKRRSDGKFGLYDVANSQFLTDMASGNAFVGGNSLGIRIG